MQRIFLFIMTCFVFAKESKSAVVLKPLSSQSIETIEASISSFIFTSDALILLPRSGNFFIKKKHKLKKDFVSEDFSTLLDQKRVSISDFESITHYRLFSVAGKTMLFNGRKIESLQISKTHKPDLVEILARRTHDYDLIKYAKDRGGDATREKQDELRKDFVKSLEKKKGKQIVSSLVSLPKSWLKKETYPSISIADDLSSLLVLTTLREYPFLIISCKTDDPTRCSFERVCSVKGFKGGSSLKGLAVIEDGQKILVGEQKVGKGQQGIIHSFKYSGCNNIEKANTRKQIKISQHIAISDIYVDKNKTLWVSSSKINNYDNNGSLFFWKKKQWLDN